MKVGNSILVAVMLLCGTVAFTQDRLEVFGEYSYLRFNPSLAGFSGVHNRSFNGGGGGVQLNFAKIFGIKGEVMGYGNTSFTQTLTSPVILPGGGVIPAGTYTSQSNMFTYLFGPVLRIPIPKVVPFGEILFGASNTNGYADLSNAIIAAGGTISKTPTQHPFTMDIGGGVDISVSHRVSIRPIEIGYVLTRYTNPLTNTNNQNSFRYCGAIVFKF